MRSFVPSGLFVFHSGQERKVPGSVSRLGVTNVYTTLSETSFQRLTVGSYLL